MLADFVHLYCDSTLDSCDFTMHKECFRAINRLRKNDDIIISKPDKRSGVIRLNKSDYVDKMNEIFDDQSKFKRLGPVSSDDNTAGIESHRQKRLVGLVKADLMPKWDTCRNTSNWTAKTSNAWFAENTQRRHSTSPYTVYDRFVSP